MIEKFISKKVSDTNKIAKKFASSMKGGEVILLDGEMGAGKTTFARAFCRALDVVDDIVSPTFTIMREYQGKFKIYHFDMYRMTCGMEACEFGLDEYIYNNKKDSIVIIEWSQNVSDILRGDFLKVGIVRTGENSRDIVIQDVIINK